MSPVKPRDRLIQHQERAQTAYDRALHHLGEIKTTYGDNYPKHTAAIDTIAIATLTIKDALQAFRTELM